ncbi:hypothetical protein D3C71_1475930 [compost metagenome]
MLHIDAFAGQLAHVIKRGIDHVGRMIDQQSFDAAFAGFFKQRPDLLDVEVAGRQHHIFCGNQVEDRFDFFLQAAIVIEDGQRDRLQHALGGLWKFFGELLVLMVMGDVVGGRKCWHPDQLRTQLQAVLDRMHVESADRVVQRHA